MDPSPSPAVPEDRRRFLAQLAAIGVSPAAAAGLWGAQDSVTPEMIAQAEQLFGLEFSDEQRDQMQRRVSGLRDGYARLRAISLPNGVPPAHHFDPVPIGRARATATGRPVVQPTQPVGDPEVPDDLEELAFEPVWKLSRMVREEAVTSVELTEMYLERLRRLDPTLHFVITSTEDLAYEQAERADAEIAAGQWRGPLHGIPWGAKDLLHTRGIRTTYGAKPFENQVIDEDATVVERLRDAGAVLVAKLTLGALAMGDVWFGETTRNPWNPEQGSSGSSAGSASATAAGCVGFAIGTETLGSIVSPCTRCGATGLRPTYGRVSRAGAMALSWTMDKIGPITRDAQDCALIFDAIQGADPRDPTAVDAPFSWTPRADLKGVRVGYVPSAFEGRRADASDREVLEFVEAAGGKLVEIELPDLPTGDLTMILSVEAATAFDELTRSGQVDEMVRQNPGAWPNSFRTHALVPAVDYVRATRIRTLLLSAMAEVMDQVDWIATPPYASGILGLTNLTGHPCVVFPHGFRQGGTPKSFTFVGQLDGEEAILQAAHLFQSKTDYHLRRPPLES